MSVPVLHNTLARRIFLHRHGLAVSPSGSGQGAELAGVIGQLGFVQLDSVNTFARAHDLILWSRRQQYRPNALNTLLSRERVLFEHWTHDAATIPMAQFPHWKLRFDRDATWCETKWAAWRREGFMEMTDAVLRQISDHGPAGSSDVGTGEKKGAGGWWDWHPSKTALEYLWRSGQLSVTRREGFRKIYDLTERVIPAEYLNTRPHPDETVDWLCNAALDRLGFATSGELAAFWDTATPQEAKDWCAAALATGDIIEVDVEGVDGKCRRSYARPDILDILPPDPPPRVRILSPFDPALRDRKRAERLFGFHYRIEIFVPAPKRTYGYYVFPVMEGDRLIGRIDMKADRSAKRLDVTAFWPEATIKMGAGRIKRLRAELDRAARFVDCDVVAYAPDWQRWT